MLRVVLPLSLLLFAWGQGPPRNFPPQDQRVLDMAAVTVDKYCSVELPEIDEESAREDLEGGAGEARMNNATAAQLADTFSDIADPGFIAEKAGAVILSIVLFVFWILCCWFVCCPCLCKCCCRCCQRRWKTGKICKGVLWLLFIAFALPAIIMVGLALTGASRIDAGIQGTACSAAQLVEDAVAGSPGDNFTGLLPAYQTLQDLSGVLNPGSSFLNQLGGIIDQTEDIQKAVNLVMGTMGTLETMMGDANNIEPKDSSGNTLYHECIICQPLADVLTETLDVFGSSTGESMAQLRTQINDQLRGPNVADLRQSIQEAMAPIDAAKEAFLDQVGFFVETDGGFQESTAAVSGDTSMLQPAVVLFFLFYLVILIAAVIALALWSVKDKQGEAPDHCCVRFCTGCVSCSACIYAMIVLLVAGILVIAAMFGSGMCLVMIDFDQESGANLFAAVGEELPDDVMTALKIADRCFSLSHPQDNPGFSRNLADIVDIPSSNATLAAMGYTSTIREELETVAIDPILDQIAAAESSLAGPGATPASLATNAKVVELMDMIGALDMEALYLPIQSKISAAGSPYEDMTATSATLPTNPFAAFLAVSLSCPDVTLGAELGADFEGDVVPGMNAMVTGPMTLEGNSVPPLQDYTTSTPTWSCPSLTTPTCAPGPTQAGCEASVAFIQDAKEPLVTENRFKCTYLVTSMGGNTRCRPANMVKNAPGDWSGTCLYGSTFRTYTRTRDCTLAEFEQHIKDAKDDLEKVFEYFDDITATLVDDILTDLQDLVQREVIRKVTGLLDNLNCGFMREFWQGLTDNMCYRGMNGFRLIANSYVISGLLSLIIALFILVPWKISRDNADKYGSEVGSYQPAP